MTSTDPTQFPVMSGSHGPKPAVGPRPWNLTQLKRMTSAGLLDIRTPWMGDRLSKAAMEWILTMSKFILDQPDDGSADDEIDEGEGEVTGRPEDLLIQIFKEAAMQPIESMDDLDSLREMVSTVTDLHERLTDRITELGD